MTERRRVKQLTSLEDRLSAWAGKVREQADAMKPGPAKDALLKKARQADVAAHIDDWSSSPGLRPPK